MGEGGGQVTDIYWICPTNSLSFTRVGERKLEKTKFIEFNWQNLVHVKNSGPTAQKNAN